LDEVAPPNTHLYVSEPSTSLICPICRDVLHDASTMLACQHVFCRECIKEALNRKRECPCCRKKPSPGGRWENLIAKNLLVNSIVGELKVHCRFGLKKAADGTWQTQTGQNWCSQILPLDQVPSHEKQCPFARIQCPMQGCKAVLMRRDMPRHLEENLGKHMEMLQADVAGKDSAMKSAALQLEQAQVKLDVMQAQVASLTNVIRNFFSRKKRRLRSTVKDKNSAPMASLLKEYEELKCDIGRLDKVLDGIPGQQCEECTAGAARNGVYGLEFDDDGGSSSDESSGSSESEEEEEGEGNGDGLAGDLDQALRRSTGTIASQVSRSLHRTGDGHRPRPVATLVRLVASIPRGSDRAGGSLARGDARLVPRPILNLEHTSTESSDDEDEEDSDDSDDEDEDSDDRDDSIDDEEDSDDSDEEDEEEDAADGTGGSAPRGDGRFPRPLPPLEDDEGVDDEEEDEEEGSDDGI